MNAMKCQHYILGILLLGVALSGCESETRDTVFRDVIESTPQASEKRGPWELYENNPQWSYKTPGFNIDDLSARRVAGNLTTLATAYDLAGSWEASPADVNAIAASPQFKAANLWNPYADSPAVLVEGKPPAGAPPGSYFTWLEGEHRWFAAVTASAVLTARKPARTQAANAGYGGTRFDEPADLLEELTFCRLLDWVAGWSHLDFPDLMPEGHAPPATLDDLKGYWWLWDSGAMLISAPFADEQLSLHGLGTRVIVDCQTPEGTIWQHGDTPFEREMYVDIVS